MESSMQGVLWTSNNSECKATGIFQALSAGAVTLVNSPLHTEHLAVTQRQFPRVLRRGEGIWKLGVLSLGNVVPVGQWAIGKQGQLSPDSIAAQPEL